MPVKNKAKTQKGTINSNPNTTIQNSLDQLIVLSNSPEREMEGYGKLIGEIVNADIRPLTKDSKCGKPLLSEWEDKVFALIVKQIIDESGSLKTGYKFTLGSATRNSDAQYGIGFSAASLIVDLLTKRGLVASISKSEFGISTGKNDDTEPSGIFKVTEVGVAYTAFFLEKRV